MVVIRTTPFIAAVPYKTAELTSRKTVILSMSERRTPLISRGIPSTTTIAVPVCVPMSDPISKLTPSPRILLEPNIPNVRPLKIPFNQIELSYELISLTSRLFAAPTTSPFFTLRKGKFTKSSSS